MDTYRSLNAVKLGAAIATSLIAAGLVTTAIRKILKAKVFSKDVPVPKKWIRVGTVSKLLVYPIKSCAGMELSEAIATPIGIKGLGSIALRDRIFMVVDYRYSFQTQRTLPQMALINVEIIGEKLTVSGPEMRPLTIKLPQNVLSNKRSCRVWEDHVREVLDCGNEIGKWLDEYLEGSGYRLVYHAVEKTQRTRTPMQEMFPTFSASDKGTFQDQTSYMLMTEESIAHLNDMLVNKVTYKNFRPTILIHGTSEPLAEDGFAFVRIGSSEGPIFKTAKPCTRCKLTTVNPSTGEFDPEGEPLNTLIEMKRSFGDAVVDELVGDMGVIGVQLGLYKEGTSIKPGDAVYAALL